MRSRRLAVVPVGLLALGATAVGLAGIVALEIRGSVRQAAPTPGAAAGRPAAPTLADAAGEAADDQAERRVATLLGRPVFTPGRRPDEDAAVGSGTGLTRLTGVMVSPLGKAAIFAGVAGGKPIVIGEGARIGVYVIRSIEAGAVTVTGPDGQHVLYPTFEPSASPKQAAAPPPPQAGRVPPPK
jgi:hypothetical protein